MRVHLSAPVWVLLSMTGCHREPTYHDDVEPILAKSCVGCHRQNGVAPTPKLETYEQAKAAAGKIKLAVQSREMPPWGADNTGICGKWRHATWLGDEEVRTLVRWASGQTPPGSAADHHDQPAPLPFKPSGITLDVGGDYAPGLGSSAYRCFLAGPGQSGEHLATAFRVSSTDPRSVAQVTVYALDLESMETAAKALDESEPGLGYTCYGSSRIDGARLLMSWTWDGAVLRLPPGVGVPLRSGRRSIVQIHYDPIATGLDVPTRTRIEIEVDDRARRASFRSVSPERLSLAPGTRFVQAGGDVRVERPMTVFGVAPRMHTLGKTMQLDRIRAERRDCIASFDHWKFYRQRLFEYAEPVRVDAGDTLHVSCVYNTQSRTQSTEMGEAIDQEECLASLLVAD